jgi:hypothetical protein
MIYFILLFALYLATQLVLIRQKAFSSIRLEGAAPPASNLSVAKNLGEEVS